MCGNTKNKIGLVIFKMAMLAVVLSVFSKGAYAGSDGWVEVSEGITAVKNIVGFRQISGTNTVFVYTENDLYRSNNLGVDWQKVRLPEEKMAIVDLEVSENSLYIGGKDIYVSSNDQNWDKIAGRPEIKGIVLTESDDLFAWTKTGLFAVAEGYFSKISQAGAIKVIDHVEYARGSFYIVSGGDVFVSSNRGETWEKISLIPYAPEEFIEDGVDEEAYGALPAIRSLDKALGVPCLTVATARGIFEINNGKTEGRIDTTGLPASEVVYAKATKNGIFAATNNTVFYKPEGKDSWATVFKDGSHGNIVYIGEVKDSRGISSMWITMENSIFGKYLHRIVAEGKGVSSDDKARSINEGPSIQEVQSMAVRYAEVGPDKIRKWRNAAKWKAIMPKVSLGFSQSDDDNVEIYKSASTTYVVEGPREVDNDYSIDLSWDLSDIIWSGDQTTIDVRSKLMVQLRVDILEEVTRLYFERKRLLAEIDDMGGSDKNITDKLTRVEEVTAYIDSFTGGGFSEAIRQ